MSYKLEYRTICFGVDPASRQPTLGIEGAFFIPSYQRGYRWTADEVTKLLDDIWESTGKRYSLQPIVVKSLGGGKWELIDGQQRLTTLWLLLRAVHYEATRAGLDPQLVLGLIQVESGFKKYALSTAGARGYMQVMPFWAKLIGNEESNLFHMRTNLRFGCTILRHYLDIEKGDLFRALGRYNGSLGKAEYPNLVRAAWERNWSYPAHLNLAQN